MTREERISALANLRHAKRCKDKEGLADETIDICIELLEQEPCDDAISRQAVKELYYKEGYIDFHKICGLPPVTQQETYANIPFLLHRESGCPLDECVKAYEKANEYLRSKSKLKG